MAGLIVCLFVAWLNAEADDLSKTTSIDWTKAREWWAFQRPVKSKLPTVSNSAWPNQQIDYFILAKIEAKQLTPSPQASKRVLVRRLFFDLTGLPPSPDEMGAFLADETDNAYERLVEELMQRQAFGERLASMWLNNVRYAEDQAHQVGSNTAFFYPNAFRYR
ncbi:MAG TPA: DUF1549 domain-containing protein, partial [Verrucomicrobiota bacterium]|nr:DUF1549 domain-containing protein [Verrucomicrobiota bacterium]